MLGGVNRPIVFNGVFTMTGFNRENLSLSIILCGALTLPGCVSPFQAHYQAATNRDGMCPGKDGLTPPQAEIRTGAKDWFPQTACEAAVIQAAVDRCIGAATTTSDVFGADSFATGAGVALDAAATSADGVFTSVGAVVSNPLFATANLVATLGTSIAKAFYGSTTPLSIKSMYAAAGDYTFQNQRLAKDEAYYKGLWNAVGSVCPQNLLLGGFEMEKPGATYSAPPR